jgi:hypothetical protein
MNPLEPTSREFIGDTLPSMSWRNRDTAQKVARIGGRAASA